MLTRAVFSGIAVARAMRGAMETLMEGELFLEKYRVDKLVGSGGMGVIYAATDVDLARRVAIKVLLPEIASSQEAATRFVNEGRAAARVEGEHVARVFAAGRTPTGVHYMVLEYLEGEDLSEVLRQRGTLGVAEAVDIMLQALQGVGEAHRHGIVHRDLKPANLFIHHRRDRSQVVKVLDFGISKSSRPLMGALPNQGLTATHAFIGSPAYISPEQLLNAKTADRRADIWSLGVILYEMLAGVPPFRHKMLGELIAAILHGSPTPLGSLRPDVPPRLQAVIARCLERDPARRIDSIKELTKLLAPFASPGKADADDPVPSSAEAATQLWMRQPGIDVDAPPESIHIPMLSRLPLAIAVPVILVLAYILGVLIAK